MFDEELEFLLELEREEQARSAPPPPPVERTMICEGCSAEVVIKAGTTGQCEYCGRFVEVSHTL